MSKQVIKDENVNYDELEQHKYDDAEGYTFFSCPLCVGEYLATFIIEENGQTTCIDCSSK